jgi:hypothetical protein
MEYMSEKHAQAARKLEENRSSMFGHTKAYRAGVSQMVEANRSSALGFLHEMKEFAKQAQPRAEKPERPRIGKKGEYDRRILTSKIQGDRRVEYHATKGRRNYRAA